jgi:predicted nucleic acid-binding protein
LGESSAIALALEFKDALLIVDDRRARKVAVSLGLEITGPLGILIRCYERGIIEDIDTAIADLRRVHFRIPDNTETLIKNLSRRQDH